jgi:ferredoxin-NADP reductase/predicted pyridoxine 5'-phosphate oxidase superfamily flavin-nucleotide-binding protein
MMPNAFATISFTESVKAAQTRYGSRENNLSFELSDDPRNELGAFEAEFIEARDSFYQATLSENSWPYVQHRGGPKGFLKVLDSRTIGFADFKGNRQYISVGNLNANPRIALILMDYPNRRRLKIWGTTRVIHESDEPELIARLEVPSYRARIERGILIHVEAIEWNCPQHITPRYTESEMNEVLVPIIEENQQLRAQASQTSLQILGEGELALVITGIRQLTPRVRAYELRHPLGNSLPDVSPGSHISVPVLLADGSKSVRHYSISSNPNQNRYYEIAVLLEKEGSGGARFIHEHYQIGMQIRCGLPHNDFTLHQDERPTVFIAGGIGITPIMAMAKALKLAGRVFQFHYIGRMLNEMAYVENLQQEFDEQLNIYISTKQNVNLNKMMANVAYDAVFYVCGPERLIKGVLKAAAILGISESRIHFERFSNPTNYHAKNIEVELRRSGKTIQVSVNETILNAVEAVGVKALSDCKIGNCGTCAVQVIEGTPMHLDSVLSERERNQLKKMCICVSRANSAKLVLDL